MTKIMLVEDDNNLREIYEARLAAEGYQIVSAQDGEAALALAAKEHPDLVISDVMMPKISGFEMLDILRNTEALRNVKVIMLTALGQAEDNARAASLGADRYLVKSQVTLEDIVKATHDVLEGDFQADAGTAAAAAPNDGLAWNTAAPEVAASDEPPVAAAVPEPATAAAPVTDMPVVPDLQLSPEIPLAVETPQPAETAPSEPTPSDTSQSEAPATDPIPMPEGVIPEPVMPAPSDAAQQAAASEADASAAPASEVESGMMAQIDDFLDTGNGTSAPAEAAGPATQGWIDPLQQAGSDQPAGDTAADTNAQADMSGDVAPPDEDDNEYAKDESTPDMGVLSIHDEAVSTPSADPATADNTPQPQAPAYELPAVPQAPAAQPEQPIAPQTSGDQVVSSALADMMAATPGASQPQTAPATSVVPQPAPAAQTVQPPIPQSRPEPAVSAPEPSQGGGSVHSRVIAPLGDMHKPDISQLLSIEEARAAAQQAGGVVQPTATGPDHQDFDPNSISL